MHAVNTQLYPVVPSIHHSPYVAFIIHPSSFIPHPSTHLRSCCTVTVTVTVTVLAPSLLSVSPSMRVRLRLLMIRHLTSIYMHMDGRTVCSNSDGREVNGEWRVVNGMEWNGWGRARPGVLLSLFIRPSAQSSDIYLLSVVA